MVLKLLVEGNGVRATSRLTGIHYDTIGDLILTVGENCKALMDSLSGIQVSEVSADEIWSFVGVRERERDMRGYSKEFGDAWSWLAVDRHSKMILAFHVGKRDSDACWTFLNRLADATTGRFSLSTDGLASYRMAVPFIFRDRVDFGQVVKKYASSQVVTRYAPARLIGTERKARLGNPDVERITTSFSETFHQKLRQGLRRFTRLSSGHSKTLKHHIAMQSIYYAYYNWVKKHSTIKQTPAQAAGIADHQWTMLELLERAAEKNFSSN